MTAVTANATNASPGTAYTTAIKAQTLNAQAGDGPGRGMSPGQG